MVDHAALYRHRFSEVERERKDAIWRVLCVNFFQKFVRADRDTVLDIACGLGEFSRHIKAQRKIGIDLNTDSVKLLPKEVEFHLTSAEEHMPHKAGVDKVLAEILRVLRPGGTYIALQPNYRFCYDVYWDFYDHHTALSDRSCAEAFAQAGFDIQLLIPKFLPFTTKTKLPTHPFFVRLYLAVPLAWKIMGKQFLIVGRKPA
jgi:SAM-dependent methyltransferase